MLQYIEHFCVSVFLIQPQRAMLKILRKCTRQKSHALHALYIPHLSFQQSVLRRLSCFLNWRVRNTRKLRKKCLQIHNVGCICYCPWRLCHHVLHGRLHCSHRVCLHQLSWHVHQVKSAQQSYCQCWKEKQLLDNYNWCSILIPSISMKASQLLLMFSFWHWRREGGYNKRYTL